MTNKVVGIEQGKKTYEQFVLKITYTDGPERELKCSFFGSSMDNPEFMVFSSGPPTDEGSYPSTMINSKYIKEIELLETREVEID